MYRSSLVDVDSLMLKPAILALLILAPQAGQPTPPVFRAGADLIVIEASVLDRLRQPIDDLQATDFRAQVDGKPRPVVVARYFNADSGKTVGRAPAAEAAAPGFVSNLSGAPGQTLIFAIDQESIPPGGEKTLFNSLTDLLDILPAADAVGLAALGGATVDVSRDRERVRGALRAMTGTRPPSLVDREVTYAEASAIADRNDTTVLKSVVNRECGNPRPPLPDLNFEVCKNEVNVQARDMMVTTRLRGRKLLSTLGSLITRLKDIDGPKQIVLVSAGLPFDADLAAGFGDLSQRAAEARVIVQALHLDEAPLDAASGKYISSPYGSREMMQGLASIATTTGGSYYRAIGRASGVVEQIALDLTHFYQLGIQRLPEDGNRRTHRIEIAVARPGATVRARSEVAAAASPLSAGDKLLALLQQPIDVAELPIQASSYVLRGDKPGTVRVILASQLGASATLPTPIEWGYIVIDRGKPIANGRLRLDMAASPAVVTANVSVPPGQYNVRIAALDGQARGGVLQFPLQAQLHEAGELQVSDLVAAPAAGNRLEPHAAISSGAKLIAMTELYARDARAFDGVDVRLEVATLDPPQTLAGLSVVLQAGGDANTRVAQPTINTELLNPGRYVLRTIVSKAGRELGRVARAIEITR